MTASEPTNDDVFGTLTDAAGRIVTALGQIATKVLGEAQRTAPVDRIGRELKQAHAVGQLTVLAASSRLRHVLAPSTPSPSTPTPAEPTQSAPKVDDVPRVPSGIPDYVNLSAAQIVPLLKGLTSEERLEVLEFEEATRGRRTILSALRAISE